LLSEAKQSRAPLKSKLFLASKPETSVKIQPYVFIITAEILLILPCSIPAQQTNIITICTFNIQNFGRTKLNDPERVKVLAEIIRKYDIVAVQEISDATFTVPGAFLDKINDQGRYTYEYACSERTGKQADDKSSREQYAFYYNAAKVSLMAEPSLYDDSGKDRFAREPYTARFKTKKGNFTFVLVTVHTDPDEAVDEIGSLDDVVKWSRKKYSQEKEIIVLGDFNASCAYARPADLDRLAIRGNNYFWPVPDDAKTNLSSGSDCAYDRFVLTLPAKRYFTGKWDIDACFTDKTISDHWPVWMEFSCSRK
jgi:endonuclease/exonuclease/phosphatase family metal-dependent hydrolase